MLLARFCRMEDNAVFPITIGNFRFEYEYNFPSRGVLPIMAYTGRLRPKGVGFSRAEVYKRVGKSVI